jgi:hypothetical protein
MALQEAGRPMRRGHRIASGQVLLRLLELELEPPDPGASLLTAPAVAGAAARDRIAQAG